MTDLPEADPPPAPPDSRPGSLQEPSRSRILIDWFSALSGNVRGAIWILLGAMLFSVVAALIKMIGLRLPVSEILLVRQAVMLVATLPAILHHFPRALVTQNRGTMRRASFSRWSPCLPALPPSCICRLPT